MTLSHQSAVHPQQLLLQILHTMPSAMQSFVIFAAVHLVHRWLLHCTLEQGFDYV